MSGLPESGHGLGGRATEPRVSSSWTNFSFFGVGKMRQGSHCNGLPSSRGASMA
jgi:hypothetical protein